LAKEAVATSKVDMGTRDHPIIYLKVRMVSTTMHRLLSALIGTGSMVDSLVLDSIRGMEEELMLTSRRVEGVGEKEGGAGIKVVAVEADLWVDTMFIGRAMNQLEQWPMMCKHLMVRRPKWQNTTRRWPKMERQKLLYCKFRMFQAPWLRKERNHKIIS
jgi:hypothetical protein